LLAALILARALRQVSGSLVAALPAGRATSVGSSSLIAAPQLPEGELAEPAVTGRFLGAMERLERRIAELEQTTLANPPISGVDPDGNGEDRMLGGNGGSYEFSVSALNQKQYALSEPTGREVPDAAVLWLGKGQAMLSLGLARDAVECFEKAVALNPDCAPDAYVKRGMALEQMQQMEAAIESYDRALAADSMLTVAYLYKGAACNRVQRYREALDCYDQALRCEQRVTEG
jgi:tetratricopeptide (TPR) repeat protein